MRKILLLLGMGAAALLTACSPQAPLKVCTLYTGAGYNEPVETLQEERWTTVGKLVAAHDFDLLCLQEIHPERLQILSEELQAYKSLPAVDSHLSQLVETCPIFYLPHRLKLLADSQFWLSETPDIPGSKSWGALFPRTVTWGKFVNLQTGHIFFVFNAHFCHLNEDARMMSSTLLLRKINEIAGHAPVVITGNFNSLTDGPAERLLAANWDPLYSFENSVRLMETKEPGLEKNLPLILTDHIFINSFFKIEKYQVHQTPFLEQLFRGHHPISSQLSFNREGRKRGGPVVLPPWQDERLSHLWKGDSR
ncbi:hypothetical protein [Geofilum rhodophaeum]|uniref:hypothetical protein n=1 Tax=Geofilum rhodophaeum TaxID=1965019 RepID=UPI0011BAD604|nr:hypothetical protein [Geofilum rhodophaeum]